jgi:two-component system chemotaxis sensor kinase CheA
MNGNRVGLVVDKVIGDHQTVIKNLGAFYVDAEGISGATILGSGAVALILDVPGLVRIAEREETKMRNGGG